MGAVQLPAINLNSACRRIMVKSILWDVQLFNTTTNLNTPLFLNTDVSYSLTLGTIPATSWAHILAAQAPPPPTNTGTEIILFNPGQYFYDNLRFDNTLAVAFAFQNSSAVNNYTFCLHLHIETFE